MKRICGMPGGKVSKTCGCEAKTRAAKDEPMGNNRNQAMKKACGSPCGIRKGCSKAQGSFKNLAEIVAAYIRCDKDGRSDQKELKKDLEHYSRKKSGTWARAVERAARAEQCDGKMYPHQRRVGRAAMALTKKPLLGLGRRKFGDFDALHDAVREAIQGITRVDVLAIYDTALRLGAFRGVLPDRVYLHAGTLKGVKNLGLIVGTKKSLATSEFPPEFRKLEAYEVENCLCIYKDHFTLAMGRQKRKE